MRSADQRRSTGASSLFWRPIVPKAFRSHYIYRERGTVSHLAACCSFDSCCPQRTSWFSTAKNSSFGCVKDAADDNFHYCFLQRERFQMEVSIRQCTTLVQLLRVINARQVDANFRPSSTVIGERNLSSRTRPQVPSLLKKISRSPLGSTSSS